MPLIGPKRHHAYTRGGNTDRVRRGIFLPIILAARSLMRQSLLDEYETHPTSIPTPSFAVGNFYR